MANGDKYTIYGSYGYIGIGIKGSTISLQKRTSSGIFSHRFLNARRPQLTVDTRFANAAANKVADLNEKGRWHLR